MREKNIFLNLGIIPINKNTRGKQRRVEDTCVGGGPSISSFSGNESSTASSLSALGFPKSLIKVPFSLELHKKKLSSTEHLKC